MKRKSRAQTAGEQLAYTIIEMVNLMYQKNTASNFMYGLLEVLKDWKVKP